MKTRTIWVVAIGLFFLGPGCQRDESRMTGTGMTEKPTEHYLTEKQLQNHIQQQISVAVDLGEEYLIQEATDVVYHTRHALSALQEGDYLQARKHINRARAKAELITLSDAESRVVAEVGIEIMDQVNNLAEAEQKIRAADSLLDHGLIQDAKRMLSGVSSEIRLTRESISIPGYVRALKETDNYLRDKKYDQAVRALDEVLSSVIYEYSVLPLPLMKAERMLDEALDQLQETIAAYRETGFDLSG